MSKSLPMPETFADKFEWAASWVRENGMSLPPDTPELRSLRNWFCFKLNQYKKNALGDRNIELLANHGIDFSEYEATNTGKGERTSDVVLVGELRQWHQTRGTYDLSPEASLLLHRSRTLLMEAYVARGRTDRARKLEHALPGFVIPLWRLTGQPAPGHDEIVWWVQAHRFEEATLETRAYLGVLHPDTDSVSAEWARKQLANVSNLKPLQRGFLVGVGLGADWTQRRIHQRREADLAASKGMSLSQPTYRTKDKRLTTFLGVCMYLRSCSVKASDKEVMAAFGITPESLVTLRTTTAHLNLHVNTTRITKLRKLFLSFGERLLDFSGMPEDHPEWINRPALLGPRESEALAICKEVLGITRSLSLKQDIALY